MVEGTPEKAPCFELANHISAPSFPCAASDVTARIGDPTRIIYDFEEAATVERMLEEGTIQDVATIIAWMQPNALSIALSKSGTRIIQAAMNRAESDQLTSLIECFRGCVARLMESPHGNYALQKMIEVLGGASGSMKFILLELARYPGGWSAVVKHAFGCRVVQRIIEHCPEQATESIVKVVKAEARTCVRNPFANYVVQSIMEHGTFHQKFHMVLILVALGIPSLSKHQIASNVVEKAFDHGDAKCKRAICEAILKCPGAIVDIACHQWGNKTVQRIVQSKHVLTEPLHGSAMQQLMAGAEVLRKSKHGKNFLPGRKFGCEPTWAVPATGGA
jgi:hypothetical protein